MEKILLLGGGGHCKVIIDAIEQLKVCNIVGILDKAEKLNDRILDIGYIGTDTDLEKIYDKGVKNCFISVGSVGDVQIRRKLYDNAKKIGFNFPNIVDQKSVVSSYVIFGEGNFVAPAAVINADTKIGNNCIINTGAIIEHDCKILDFVHIAPNATVCGNVEIGENSHIGAGSVILQGIKIGKNVMIGAGSVITKDVIDNVVIFGVRGVIKKNG